MKKRVISVCVLVSLFLFLMPVTVLAASDYVLAGDDTEFLRWCILLFLAICFVTVSILHCKRDWKEKEIEEKKQEKTEKSS